MIRGKSSPTSSRQDSPLFLKSISRTGLTNSRMGWNFSGLRLISRSDSLIRVKSFKSLINRDIREAL